MILQRTTSQLLIVLTALLVAVGVAGCADAMDEAGVYSHGAPPPGAPPNERASQARSELATHRIEDARQTYEEILREFPDNGYASAGRAITSAMLLAGSPAAGRLITEHLGADSRLDAQRAIFARKGYLYWRSRGARWENEGKFDGIRNLIADRLPWTSRQLESLSAFVEGQESPVDASRPELLTLLEDLRAIEADIDTALADASFLRLVIPGETFHDKELMVVVGRSELAVLAAASAGLRAAVHYALAYRHTWSLQQAFGDHWQEEVEMADGEREHWTARDFGLAYLDDRLARQLHDTGSERLRDARTALQRALAYASTAIERGLDGPGAGSLDWSRVNRSYTQNLQTFLDKISQSLERRTELPFTEPTLTADFSVLFTDGRSLSEEVDWLSWEEVPASDPDTLPGSDGSNSDGSDSDSDSDGSDSEPKKYEIRWSLNAEAIQRIFVDGVFMPGFDVGSDDAPTFELAGESADRFVENLAGRLVTRFEDAYLARQ